MDLGSRDIMGTPEVLCGMLSGPWTSDQGAGEGGRGDPAALMLNWRSDDGSQAGTDAWTWCLGPQESGMGGGSLFTMRRLAENLVLGSQAEFLKALQISKNLGVSNNGSGISIYCHLHMVTS